MQIKGNGNVQINTNTDAGYRLDVNGTGRFTSTLLVGGISTFSNTVQYSNNGNQTNLVTYSSNQDKGITNFYQAQNFPSSNNYTRILDIVSSGDASGGGAIRFLTSVANTAPATSMLISSNGNVGINRTTPDAKLQVVGDIYVGGYHDSSKLCIGADLNDYLQYNSGLDGILMASYGATAFYTGASSTERMRIQSNGCIGIGGVYDTGIQLMIQSQTNSSTSYIIYGSNSTPAVQFYVRSDAYGYLNDTAWHYGSDLRMKENISDILEGLSIISELKPKHFDYIDGAKNRIGFIAQEVQNILPNLVSISNEETGMLALQTDALIPYLVKAIQEQQALITSLQSQINNLKNK
jgi:hypothetical protein